jgi:type I restriction enzyme R subunit
MTGAASDPATRQPHIGKRPKARRELIAKRAKKAADPLKLVIVRDMWLTGFDAPPRPICPTVPITRVGTAGQ